MLHTELQNKLLTPTVNGLVVPAVALLFATLTSTTITTLRQRQVEIRRAINMEAGELRAIECLLDSIVHGPVQDQCREYVSRLRCKPPSLVPLFPLTCLSFLLLFANTHIRS
jgi:hypothetical protein